MVDNCNSSGGDYTWNTTIPNTATQTQTQTAANSNSGYINWGGNTFPINIVDQWANPISAPYYDSAAIYETRIKELERQLEIIKMERELEKTSKIMNEMPYWYLLESMLYDMRQWIKNGGEKIISADTKALEFGFVCINGYRSWTIKMSEVKSLEQRMFISDGKAVVIPDCFYSAAGKEYLLEVINAK